MLSSKIARYYAVMIKSVNRFKIGTEETVPGTENSWVPNANHPPLPPSPYIDSRHAEVW